MHAVEPDMQIRLTWKLHDLSENRILIYGWRLQLRLLSYNKVAHNSNITHLGCEHQCKYSGQSGK